MRFKKDIRSLPFLVLLLACFFSVSGCNNNNKSDQPNKQLQEQVKKLQEENGRLRLENEMLKTKLDNPVDQTTSSSTPSIAASPALVKFEDIKGVGGEKEITQLAKLGVFDTTSGKFNPKKPITRAEFVRWLVRANNAIFAEFPDRMVPLPETKKATFLDVPPTHRDFPYIQAMADAGFVTGLDGKTFKPNENLTREEMLAIKVALDRRNAINNDTGSPPGGWTDSAQISKKYWPAVHTESMVQGNTNVTRIFGQVKTFQPQAPVTRAEAALGASAIADSFGVFTTAEEVLQKRAPQALP